LLTNKAGKQKAKQDDDEREAGEHGVPNRRKQWPDASLAGYLNSLTRGPGACQGVETLDSFISMHNNTVMNAAQLAPVVVRLNIAGSSGATG
jgi:hypothetical protein